jgi:hypothetical protein
LGDVVVVGYGKQKKVNLVGAVSAVTVDEKMTSRAVPNISSGLEGMVPGLAVTNNSGMVGNNQTSLLIRGLGTINNANPLVVVDGVPDVDINRVNVNDIESVSVFKRRYFFRSIWITARRMVSYSSPQNQERDKRERISLLIAQLRLLHLQRVFLSWPTIRVHSHWSNAGQQPLFPSTSSSKNGTIDQWMALGMIDPLRFSQY